MIKSNKGHIQMEGTALELSTDFVGILKGLRDSNIPEVIVKSLFEEGYIKGKLFKEEEE